MLSFVFKTIVIIVHPFPSSPCSPFSDRGVSRLFALFPAAPPPPFPCSISWVRKAEGDTILVYVNCYSMHKTEQIHYPARKRKKNVRRGKEGVRLPLCLFFSQNIKLHTHTTCPLHHTILTLFKVEGGGVGEVSSLLTLSHRSDRLFYLYSRSPNSISLCVYFTFKCKFYFFAHFKFLLS